MQNPHPIGVYKRWHYAFLFLFGLFSCFFITAVAVWINYRSIFESGLLGFFHVCTGVLIGLYIGADVLELSTDGSTIVSATAAANLTATGESQRVSVEVARQLTLRRYWHEYRVYRRGCATMIIITLLAVLLSVLYLYNLIYLIATVCPQMHHSHASVQNTLELRLSYEHVPAGEYYAKRNHLLLRYDTTGRTIVQRQRHTNPNVEAYHNWFTRNEVHAYDSVRPHANGTDEGALFCMKRGATIFDFLQNEINQVLYRNLETRRSQSSFRILDLSHWGTPLRATSSNEDEEDMDFHMMTRKMCRDEYGFIIGLITFILLWDLLCIVNFAYNVWLYRHDAAPLEPPPSSYKTAGL